MEDRFVNPHRSKSAKLAWKRYRSNYNRGNRKKERDYMDKSFYAISKDLEKAIDKLDEAKVIEDDVFDLNYQIDFDNISGGLAFNIDKDNNNVSFSTALSENGRGVYRPVTEETSEDDLKILYDNIQNDIQQIVVHFDEEIKQLLNKYGLKQI